MEKSSKYLSKVNLEIVSYVDANIIPLYDHFDLGHGRAHVLAVIDDCLSLAETVGADFNLTYVIAAYHDTGMSEGREFHHLASGRVVENDCHLKRWFSMEEIALIKEAVEDHRASGKEEPRSIYGKIVADGDRQLDPQTVMTRCLQFGLKNYSQLDKSGHYERFREHLLDKYSKNGYLKLWISDGDKARKLSDLHGLIEDETALRRCFEEVWKNLENSNKPEN